MTAVVVAQGGELDIATVTRLMERLHPHRQPGREVVLDLSRVLFMDCYSLGHILAAHADSATEGWTLRVRVETPAVLRMLDLTGAARMLPLDVPATT
jgi:anti-anti-sigma factor